jgi:hypothetical protein
LFFSEVPEATRERLVREVMRVDQVDWEAANLKVDEMDRVNDRFGLLLHVPHQSVLL